MLLIAFYVVSFVLWGLYNMIYNDKKLFHPVDFLCGMLLAGVGYFLGYYEALNGLKVVLPF